MPDEPAVTPQAVSAAKVVFLKEGQDVFLIDLDYSHLYCAKVYRAEGEGETLVVREDVAP